MDPYDWLCGFLPTRNQTSDDPNSGHIDPLAQAFKDAEETISRYSQAQIMNCPPGSLNTGLSCASTNPTDLQPQSGQYRGSQQQQSSQQPQPQTQPHLPNTSSGPFHDEAHSTFVTSPEPDGSGPFQNEVNPQTSHPVAMAYQTTDPNSIHNPTHVVPSAIFPATPPRYSATNQASHPGPETKRPISHTEAMDPLMRRAQPASQRPGQNTPVIFSHHVSPTYSHTTMQRLNSPTEQDEHPVHQRHSIGNMSFRQGSTIISHTSPTPAQELDTSVSMGSIKNAQNNQRLPQSAVWQDNRPTPIPSSKDWMRPAQSPYQNLHQVSSTIPAFNSLGRDLSNGRFHSPTLMGPPSTAPSDPHKGSKTSAAHGTLKPQSLSAAPTTTSVTPPVPMARKPTLAKNQEHTGGTLPPAKVRRLENGNRQPVVAPKPPCTQPFAHSFPRSGTVEGHVARNRGGKPLRLRNDLARPINADLALAKVSYDFTAIARDVLLVAGIHPGRKPLNYHLKQLKLNFKGITSKTDLQTFRWDLVDVKQPETFTCHTAVSNSMPMHHPEPVPLSTSRVSPGFIQPSGLDSAPQLASAGRSHPQSPMYSRDRTRDAFTTRPPPTPTNIDACAPPKGLSSWATLPFKPPTYHSPRRVPTPNSHSAPLDSESWLQTPLPSVSVSHHKPQTKHARPGPPPTIERNTAKSTPDSSSKNQQIEVQLDSDQVSKPAEAQRMPQPKVVISSSPGKMSGNRRPGRPPKRAFEVVIPEKLVEYPVYECQWEDCVAELHNISSLMTHVVKNHIPHHLTCEWKGCGNKKQMAAAAMFSHVSEQHISEMAWKFGDGPLVPKTVRKVSNWIDVLADITANQPSGIPDPTARRGTMILPVDEYQLKAFSKAHGIVTDRAKANALIEAGRHWKRQVGPDLDQDCRRLSTPARQTKVCQTEVYALEVSSSSPD